MGQPERNVGVDLLRILSMLLVVVLHILSQGGVLAGVELGSPAYAAAWLMECAAFCAVDCYALITGFVSVNGAFRPVTTGQYWYFTAYAALFFLLPFLNRMLRGLSRRQFGTLAGTAVLFLSVLPLFASKDIYRTGEGYSLIWLSALYVLGAYFGRFGAGDGAGGRYLLCYAACTVLSWAGKVVLDWRAYAFKETPRGGLLALSYTSPLVLAAAVCLLLWAAGLKCRGTALRRAVAVLAPASFGVYLFHVNPLIFTHVLKGSFAFLEGASWSRTALTVLAGAAVIYLACSAVELLRLRLYRLLGLGRLTAGLGERVKFLWE